MPFRSKKQERYFQMIAHNPEKAKKKDGLTQEVAKEYIEDSKKERFSKIKKKLKK